MAFAGVSLIVDGKLCDSTSSPVDAGADSGYHLLVVRGYSRAREKALSPADCGCILSSPFIVGGHRWNLEFYPVVCDDKEEDDEFISVFLILDPSSATESESVETQFVFSFIDQPELSASTRNRQSQRFAKYENGHGEERFAKREVLERSRHMKNDGFAIRCDVVVVKPDANTREHEHGGIQIHCGDLLHSTEGADITFDVGGEMFPAHRCVLAARSGVFKAQLFGAMDDGACLVKINSIEAGVFRGLLTFIYTGAMPDLKMADMEDDRAKEDEGKTAWLLQLLEAADQYDVQRLKSICEEMLAGRYICATTVADILGVAERRRCLLLKQESLEFIKTRTKLPSVFTPDGLEQVISNCSPSVLKELLSKFAA
ncbi:hypothetical protein QYE76_013823 [Lolium multiflorum]|uniref:Uncharacterized protein n=1 Tax=Lolium multiflorum TaxID=4521 RepID=A0AAD8X594_LOLMU|nr:hypothetical protein QYE76_013823 [Lolium multiflorum]